MPFSLAHGWFLRDEPDLEFANGHAAVRTIQVRVETCAGLQLQDVRLLVEDPHPGESGVQVAHQNFRAPVQHIGQEVMPGECQADLGTHGRQADLFLQQ